MRRMRARRVEAEPMRVYVRRRVAALVLRGKEELPYWRMRR